MSRAPRNELEAYATLRAQARHQRQHQRGNLYRLPAQKRRVAWWDWVGLACLLVAIGWAAWGKL